MAKHRDLISTLYERHKTRPGWSRCVADNHQGGRLRRAWKNIGAALAIGKAHALKVTGANAAWGQNYSREFCKWIKEHGFADMRPSDRSYAIALHEQFGAIVAWRATLSDRERNRLRSAQANVKRWRASTGHCNSQCPGDLKRQATAHWRRFVQATRLLPPTEAETL